jgi:hypothetical protein
MAKHHILDANNTHAATKLRYISDTWGDGGLIVYDFTRNRARRFDDPSLHPDPGMHVEINGRTFNFPLPSDGIAMSHDASTVYVTHKHSLLRSMHGVRRVLCMVCVVFYAWCASCSMHGVRRVLCMVCVVFYACCASCIAVDQNHDSYSYTPM